MKETWKWLNEHPLISFPLLILVMIFFILLSSKNEQNAQQEATTQSESSREISDAQWKDGEAKQPKRKEFIQKLINRGIFKKVDYWEHGATVIVDSNFYLLDFDDKKNFVNVVYAYVTVKNRDEFAGVILKDSLDNKTVGEFSSSGLEMK